MLMSVMITGLRSTEHKLNLHRSAKVLKATKQAEIQKGIDNTAEKNEHDLWKGSPQTTHIHASSQISPN